MIYRYDDSWNLGWDWFLWLGVCFLLIAIFGYMSVAYRSYRRYSPKEQANAIKVLNERYARGDIEREEFSLIKLGIAAS